MFWSYYLLERAESCFLYNVSLLLQLKWKESYSTVCPALHGQFELQLIEVRKKRN
jgi:hypothetical protein